MTERSSSSYFLYFLQSCHHQFRSKFKLPLSHFLKASTISEVLLTDYNVDCAIQQQTGEPSSVSEVTVGATNMAKMRTNHKVRNNRIGDNRISRVYHT